MELGVYSGAKSFGYEGKEGTCLWCGDRLHYQYDYRTEHVPAEGGASGHFSRSVRDKRAELPGPYRDGFFDTMRCAYRFGVRMAEFGRRLKQDTVAHSSYMEKEGQP